MGSYISQHSPPAQTEDIYSVEGCVSPLLRLNDDILYRILMVVAKKEPVWDIHGRTWLARRNPKHPSYNECLGWMRLSSVCRRWRTVVNGAARLWAGHVFFLPPSVAGTALARSGTGHLNMLLPAHEDNYPPLLCAVATAKKWGLPPAHRERLLNLAISQSHRMNGFYAEDLAAPEYRSIFQTGLFDSLISIHLDHIHDSSGLQAGVPSRRDLGDLRLTAPRLHTAYLSPTLPIAYDEGPGLHLDFPALRELHVSERHDTPLDSCLITDVDQLRWIPHLIRRCALNLRVLDVTLVTYLEVDWPALFGRADIHLPKLHTIRFMGIINARLHVLFKHIVEEIPRTTAVNVVIDEDTQMLQEAFENYGLMMEQSLRSHSFDCIYIHPIASYNSERTQLQLGFQIVLFSSTGLSNSGLTLPNFVGNLKLVNCTGRTVFSLMLLVKSTGSPDPAVAMISSALNLLSPVLAEASFNTLVLDTYSSTPIANAVRQVLRASLPKVTTLHCIDATRPIKASNASSGVCTKALRVVYDVGMHNGSSLTPDRHILPYLQCVAVSMRVERIKATHDVLFSMDDVRIWWEELVQALTSRHTDAVVRLRKLRIVGGWESKKLRERSSKMDAKMLALVATLVEEVEDKRAVYY